MHVSFRYVLCLFSYLDRNQRRFCFFCFSFFFFQAEDGIRDLVRSRGLGDVYKRQERGHLLEGLAVALSNVDEIIALIKAAPTPSVAKDAIMAKIWRSPLVEEMLSRALADANALRPDGLGDEFGLQAQGYRLSDAQAQAILELRLQRLTGLEQEKIVDEYREVMDKIIDYLDILANPERITHIITEELDTIRQQFGDKRRSEIVIDTQDLSMEDLITPADVVVTLSHGGYIQSQILDDYRAQKRGGRGQQAHTTTQEEVAELSGTSRTYITKLENDKQDIEIMTLKKIVEAGLNKQLNISIE